jgi:hypothetical protein
LGHSHQTISAKQQISVLDDGFRVIARSRLIACRTRIMDAASRVAASRNISIYQRYIPKTGIIYTALNY